MEEALYYEVISPPHSGMPVIIQEFAHTGSQPACIGVAGLNFGTEQMEIIEALDGHQEGAHYGPPDGVDNSIHDVFVPKEISWLFAGSGKTEVIAFVHRLVQEIEARYAQGGEEEK